MVNKTILHYRIIKELGRGGMGVVYKAIDTKLKRDVAIKFLPQNISVDKDEKKRFEIEAQAAASLSHPNVTTIFAIEEFNDLLFIVMEFIDGIELKDKIKEGPVSTDEAIDIAVQIAGGLNAAHRKGIIHRDIKSQNILLTKEDVVKIMDFGIAKVRGRTQLTEKGTTLGTIAYMSPEQSKGGQIDQRTDIWSFGVVMYEILTGELPFRGDYDQAVIYSIMNSDPESLYKYLPKENSDLINIISKTLEKEPENRYQKVSDIIDDLNHLREKNTADFRFNYEKQTSGSSKVKARLGNKHSNETKFSGLFLRNVIKIVGFTLILILSAIWYLRSSLPKINPDRLITNVQLPITNFDYPAISPDGKMIAVPGSDINGNWDIYLVDIHSGESRKLNAKTATKGITGSISAAVFSPDGSTITFGAINLKTGIEGVYDISVLSSFVRVIADTGIVLNRGHKNNRIYYLRGKPRAPSKSGWREYWSILPDGSKNRLEFIDSLLHGATNSFTFSLSPDDKKAAFTRSFEGGYNEIMVRNLVTGKENRLTNDHNIVGDLAWLSNGYILFNSDRSGNYNIWIIPEQGGETRQVTDESFNDLAMTMSPEADRLIYQQQSTTGTLWKVTTDGSVNKQVFAGKNVWDASFSPDGEKIAVIFNKPNSNKRTLMLKNLKNGRLSSLVPANSYKVEVQWSPSGRYISYHEFPEGPLVSSSRIKILDLSKGNHPHDFGYGRIDRWLNDSILAIRRIYGKNLTDYKHLGGRGRMLPADYADAPKFSPRLLNLQTGQEMKFIRDSISYAVPVLNNSRIIYSPKNSSYFYFVSKTELDKNPAAKGIFLFDARKIGIRDLSCSDECIYYDTKNALWKLDLTTLRISKILDLSGIRFTLSRWDNSDRFISYVQHQTKKNIVMIDSLFVH